MFLGDALDLEPATAPFRGDDRGAAVGIAFFEAGGFGEDEAAKSGEHVRQCGSEGAEDFLRENGSGHCGNMLTMTRGAGNETTGDEGESEKADPSPQPQGFGMTPVWLGGFGYCQIS
jgi:hypothetical protein